MLKSGAWLSASLWNECVKKTASLKPFLSQERAPAWDGVINFSCSIRSKRSSQRWNTSSVCSWLCNITRAHFVNMFTYEIKHQKEKKRNLKRHVSKGQNDGMQTMASTPKQNSSRDARCSMICGKPLVSPFQPQHSPLQGKSMSSALWCSRLQWQCS